MRKILLSALTVLGILSFSFLYSQGPNCDGTLVCIPPGPTGSIGPQGMQGSTGPGGPAGPTGPCCPFAAAYVSLYSKQNQTIISLSPAILEAISATSGPFDISMAPINGSIKILKKGVYLINWGVDGLLAPPYPDPVPAWSFGMAVNSILDIASTSGSFSITPDDLCTHNSGVTILSLNVGDIVQLVNNSTNPFHAVSSLYGAASIIASARVNLVLLLPL